MYNKPVKNTKINTYIAIFIFTLFAAGATIMLVRVAETTTFAGYDGTDPLSALEAGDQGNK